MNDETTAMSSAFREMLIGSALAAAERQSITGGVIGGRAWSVDLGARQIAFENGPQLAADLLGTGSSADQTCLWAWANPELTLSEDRLGPARQLTVLGAEDGARELTEGRLEFRDAQNIHQLGAVASGLLTRTPTSRLRAAPSSRSWSCTVPSLRSPRSTAAP